MLLKKLTLLMALFGSPAWAMGQAAKVPAPKKGEDMAKNLEGTWRLVALEVGSKAVDPDTWGRPVKREFSGTKSFYLSGLRGLEGEFSTDPSKTPKWINESWKSGTRAHGIYEIKGDTLRLFMVPADEPRPTEFKTKEGSKQAIAMYEREKAGDDPKKADGPAKVRVLFAEKEVQPERDVPKEAKEQRPGPNPLDAKPTAFSKFVEGKFSSITVTYFDKKSLKDRNDTEAFLSRLLTTPKGSTYHQILWSQVLDVPTVATTVEHKQGKPGVWLVWDWKQSVYFAYKDGNGRWWFGSWFIDEIPR